MPAWLTWSALRSLPWRYIGVALAALALALLIWRAPWAESRGFHKRDAEVAALQKTIADVREAQAKAAADNLAHVQQREAAQDAITKEKTDALATQLVDARAAVAAYVRRLHDAQAHQGAAGGGALPQAPDTAEPTDGAGQGAVVPVSDLQICAENTVKAQGWQDWWKAQTAIQGITK